MDKPDTDFRFFSPPLIADQRETLFTTFNLIRIACALVAGWMLGHFVARVIA